MSSATKDKDEDFDYPQYDCNAAGYDNYYEAKLAYYAGVVDDRGNSLADHLLGLDEGGAAAGAMPMPAGAKSARVPYRSTQACSAWGGCCAPGPAHGSGG